MKEAMGEFIGRMFGKKKEVAPLPEQPESPRKRRPFFINRASDPDGARLQVFFDVPGAVRGTIRTETRSGVHEIDFDHRAGGGPTHRFYPKLPSGQEV